MDLPDQAALAASDDAVYVADPRGHVLRLDVDSLETGVRLENPAHPSSMAVGDGVLYTADDEGVSPVALIPEPR